ncbi:DUF4097 family beta strand repeat-containing protein [Streptomyces sp. NPDC086023]|uniref:DUF4097 family beta strand repeat-containing protein n=1 Tax=Streptomyces sp. NPDC086023 TaxID=3365746 RepID=UPI0037D96497
MKPTRTATACAAVVAAALCGSLLTACSSVGLGDETATRSYTVADKVTALSVESPGGDIEVTGGSGSVVKVTETVTYSGKRPRTGQTVSGGELSLNAGPDCGPEDDSDCVISYKVEVPSGLSVKLVGFAGDITVRKLTGDVEARTTGGSVHAEGLAGTKLLAKVSGGDVSATFASAPKSVEAGTDGGDVTVKVPNSAAYAVDASAIGGSEKVDVRTDPASGNRIKVSTTGGSVSVTT